ncbi:MAG: hypothetical protein LBD77_11040 [Bifidobacteriaceae bacterium]|jgi:hypothetical protein|nr:hypothetical protein [Bifidobacteriaceae bacterium]
MSQNSSGAANSDGPAAAAIDVVKSFGRLVGASLRASGKAMDGLSDRLRRYAEGEPPTDAPVTSNPS